jgi:hypothetical protein
MKGWWLVVSFQLLVLEKCLVSVISAGQVIGVSD